jgi:hypothetical protein
MSIEEMIKQLTKIRDEKGNVEVYLEFETNNEPVTEIIVEYNKHEGYPYVIII